MKRNWYLAVILAFFMVSCQQGTVEPTAAVTATPSASATVTQTATITATPTRTPRPTRPFTPTYTITPTPTVTPPTLAIKENLIGQGTILPDVEPISLSNIEQLAEIARWGYGHVFDQAITPDESQVVLAVGTGILWLDADTLQEEKFIPFERLLNPSLMRFSTSVEELAVVEQDMKEVLLVSTQDGTIHDRIEKEGVQRLWFSPDGNSIFVATDSKFEYESYQWDKATRQWTALNMFELSFMDFSTDGSIFIASYWWGNDVFLSVDGEQIDLREAVNIDWGTWESDDFELSEDGSLIAIGDGNEYSVSVWDVATQEIIFYHCLEEDGCREQGEESSLPTGKLSSPDQNSWPIWWVEDVKISPNNRYLVLETKQRFGSTCVYAFDLQTGAMLKKVEDTTLSNVIFFQNNTRYLSGNKLYDVRYKAPIAEPNTVLTKNFQQFSPAGDLVVNIVGETLKLLDTQTWQDKYQYTFPAPILDVQFFNHDSKIVVTLWNDHQDVHIWDYRTGAMIRISDDAYPEPFGWYYCAQNPSVSFDDQMISFSICDGDGYLYDLPEKELIELSLFGVYRFSPVKNELFFMQGEFSIKNPRLFTFEEDDGPVPIENPELDLCGLSEDSQGRALWGYFNTGEGYFCDTTEKESIRIFLEQAEESYTIAKPSLGMDWAGYPYITVISEDALFFGYESNMVYVFSLSTNHALYQYSLPVTIESIAVSPDGNYLVVNTADGVTHIYGVPLSP